jgi:hypothetical protein
MAKRLAFDRASLLVLGVIGDRQPTSRIGDHRSRREVGRAALPELRTGQGGWFMVKDS